MSARWMAAVAAVALLWCNGAVAAETRAILLRGWLGLFSGAVSYTHLDVYKRQVQYRCLRTSE